MAAAGSIILILPLFGALLLALAGRYMPRRFVETAACSAIFGSLAVSVILAATHWGQTDRVELFTWFSSGDFTATISLAIDPLSMIMALMVTFVSFIIHVYSVWYMRDDEGYARYFCYLNLFVFFMLVIVLADDLVFLFLGWEGVGFCSYALIGFWFLEEERARAGRKAFILTRIGDVAFLVALALFFVHFKSLSLTFINGHTGIIGAGLATLLGLLLLWAATGKSAQLPLLVWLPDAMAGPTPVSALIHAATMVTAGVYLLMRLFPVLILSPAAMTAVAVVGGVTAFIASCSALAQRDIKRVLAWSTISQVGYMFLGIGAGDLAGSMFHLLSHAFFKALLFMAAGCVIQALHEEHDIFKMGRKLRKAKPELFWLFLIGGLALAAIPPVSGFFSKERILMADYGHAGWIYTILWVLGTIAAALTALYTFRLIFLVFFGDPADGESNEPSKLPTGMTRVLWPLAVLSVIGGLINLPGDFSLSNGLARVLSSVTGVIIHIESVSEVMIGVVDTLAALVGLYLAYLLYSPKARQGRRGEFETHLGFWHFFSIGFGIDWFYRTFIAGPFSVAAGVLWRRADEGGIDALAMGLGKIFERASREVRLWNTGKLTNYLTMFMVGLFVILIILAWSIR